MSQPLNTDIKIYRTIRSYRNWRKFDSVGTIIRRLRPLVMSVPGHELTTIEVKSRDLTKADFSVYGRDGFPIVVGLHGELPFAVAQENLPGIDFAFQIGQDKFLHNTEANLERDLHQDTRNLEQANEIVTSV